QRGVIEVLASVDVAYPDRYVSDHFLKSSFNSGAVLARSDHQGVLLAPASPEIAAGDDDVTGIATRRLCGGCEGRFRRASRLDLARVVAQRVEPRRQIVETVGNDVNDAFFALQFAGAAQESGAERGAAEPFEDGGPDDQIGDTRLVLDRDEHNTVGAARTLADQHNAG